MIHQSDKNYLIEELRKHGNVLLACNKTKIARSTYYRWINEDLEFDSDAKDAIDQGRENMCDAGESVIFEAIKNKDQAAAKFYLTHNHPNYRRVGNMYEKIVRPEDQGLFGILKRSLKSREQRKNTKPENQASPIGSDTPP